MNEVNLYSVEEAIDMIRFYKTEADRLPLIVGVFSLGADAGKSYFCSRSMKDIHEKNNWDIAFTRHPGNDPIVDFHFDELEYLLLEMEHNSYSPDASLMDSVQKRIKGAYGRGFDRNVLVFNPRMIGPDIEKLDKHFDLLVSNPGSQRKIRSKFNSYFP